MAKPTQVIADCNGFLDGEARRTGNGRLLGGDIVMIGALPHGMKSGAPSAMLCVELGGGARLFAQVPMTVFLQAAQILAAAYPAVPDQEPSPTGKPN